MDVATVIKKRNEAAKEIANILQELVNETAMIVKDVAVKCWTHSSLAPGDKKVCLIGEVNIELVLK